MDLVITLPADFPAPQSVMWLAGKVLTADLDMFSFKCLCLSVIVYHLVAWMAPINMVTKISQCIKIHSSKTFKIDSVSQQHILWSDGLIFIILDIHYVKISF